jgi:hypothetical protein|tara:strand:+ start:1337 stop:1528 length:192 start_codon:yes stop_codon:yes gene_type:complete
LINNKIDKKEAYRLFYLVKGHIGVNEQTARECYDNYFKRCWYNLESWTREDAFLELWRETYGE